MGILECFKNWTTIGASVILENISVFPASISQPQIAHMFDLQTSIKVLFLFKSFSRIGLLSMANSNSSIVAK